MSRRRWANQSSLNRGRAAAALSGTQAVADAAPDGYHVLRLQRRRDLGRAVRQKVRYDPVRDIEPVTIVSSIVQAVVTKKDLPIKTTGRTGGAHAQEQSRQAQLRLKRAGRIDALRR